MITREEYISAPNNPVEITSDNFDGFMRAMADVLNGQKISGPHPMIVDIDALPDGPFKDFCLYGFEILNHPELLWCRYMWE